MSRDQSFLAHAQVNLMEHFSKELTGEKKIKFDVNGYDQLGFACSSYVGSHVFDEIMLRLEALIGFGFEKTSSDDSMTYSKFVPDVGAANVSYNKQSSRLNIAVVG